VANINRYTLRSFRQGKTATFGCRSEEDQKDSGQGTARERTKDQEEERQEEKEVGRGLNN
jgi:hypothetical protein